MKRDDSNMDATIDSHLGLYNASSDQLEVSGERIRQRVQAELANSPVIATELRARRPWFGRVWRVALEAAAGIVIVLSATYVLLDRPSSPATVADGLLYRASGNGTERVKVGQD